MVSASDDAPCIPLDPDVDVGSSDGSDPLVRRRRERQVQDHRRRSGLRPGSRRRRPLRALLGHSDRDRAVPWGTFLINVSGSAVLGFILILLIEQFPRGRLARPVIGTGFIGVHTTFSTFMVAAIVLIRDGRPENAVAYLVGSVSAGLLAVGIGMTSARLVLRTERWLQEEL